MLEKSSRGLAPPTSCSEAWTHRNQHPESQDTRAHTRLCCRRLVLVEDSLPALGLPCCQQVEGVCLGDATGPDAGCRCGAGSLASAS